MKAEAAKAVSKSWLIYDAARWRLSADILAFLVVISLPWSTSLPAIFVSIWMIVLAPTVDIRQLMATLKRPVCLLPILFCGLSLLGMLWSDVPWEMRVHAASSSVKFLVLPLLVYHFERSSWGLRILAGFIASCFLLAIMSWVVAFEPRLALAARMARGVPVKNYIDQSQEFVFCTVVLAWPVLQQLRKGARAKSALLILTMLVFVSSMFFVVVARTALVCLPFLALFFAVRYLSVRETLISFGTIVVLAVAAWNMSPMLQRKSESIFTDFSRYETSRASTSGGQRLEFWRKSLHFFAEAPLIGHGTGSTLKLFEDAAVNQTGVSAEIVANPHNQTLYSAIQWGFLGVAILYAMWFLHIQLFRGASFEAWVGSLIVIQTFVSSIFNSHLLDFHEGWMYVLGVGIAGGTITALKPQFPASRSRNISEVAADS